ncbi:hypothetical protein BC833DRAFT_564457 [Globomyces pollinis-pini]|nr:hypothetical protein BC833DRAFT_564457 [Globomyces pollinis-pini]
MAILLTNSFIWYTRPIRLGIVLDGHTMHTESRKISLLFKAMKSISLNCCFSKTFTFTIPIFVIDTIARFEYQLLVDHFYRVDLLNVAKRVKENNPVDTETVTAFSFPPIPDIKHLAFRIKMEQELHNMKRELNTTATRLKDQRDKNGQLEADIQIY